MAQAVATPTMSIRDQKNEPVEIPAKNVSPAMIREAKPYWTFRLYLGQRHYSGSYWSSTRPINSRPAAPCAPVKSIAAHAPHRQMAHNRQGTHRHPPRHGRKGRSPRLTALRILIAQVVAEAKDTSRVSIGIRRLGCRGPSASR
jgi:hypothetical protein